MLTLPPSVKIYLATQPVDARKSFDGLAAIVESEFALTPMSGHLFVFVNRRGHLAAVRVRGTNWLLEEQGPDGSWNTDRPIWRFPAPGDDAWLALDSQNLVTTSLAIGALRTFPLTATKRKEQENG